MMAFLVPTSARHLVLALATESQSESAFRLDSEELNFHYGTLGWRMECHRAVMLTCVSA
jgi:hypothetical protein